MSKYRTLRSTLQRPAALAVSALIAGAALAACGGGSSSAAAGPGSSGDATAFSAQVKENLSAAAGPQTRRPPTDGPRAVPGKKIAIISFTLAEEGAQRIVGGLKDAGQILGWQTTVYDGQAVPSTANDRIQQAISTKPDAIVIVALDAALIAGSLQDAKAAGIPVACNTCADLADPGGRGPFVSVSPAVSRFEDMGYLVAQYAYERTNGNPKFLSMNDQSLSNLRARETGLKRFLKDCTDGGGTCDLVQQRPFLVADLNTKLPLQAADLARANPSFNTMWLPFDYAALQAISGLSQAGLTSTPDTFAVASNGDGANLDLIAKDGYQKATVGISFEWGSFATMDNLNRLFAGKPTAEEYVPIRLFDRENVAEAKSGAWKGDVDFVADFTRVWKEGTP